MSGEFDELIERLTTRLAADAELRMEIGEELRTHLDECAAEFARGGMTFDDAKAAATKVLGDEEEISDKLWQANRRRMKLRKAARWAFGVSAGPVAAVAVIGVGWSSLVSICVLLGVMSLGSSPQTDGFLYRHAQANLLASMPPESRFVYDTPGVRPERIQWAASLASQHPTDPVFAANYVCELLFNAKMKDNAPQILAACDRGSQIEPDNAFFHLVSSAVYLDGSTTVIDDPATPDPATSFNWEASWNTDPKGRPQVYSMSRWRIDDATKLQQGLAEFHRAAQCAYLDAHMFDMLQKRLGQLPPATRLSDHLLRMMTEFSVILPYLNSNRETVNIACSVALDAADQKQSGEALGLVADARRIAGIAIPRARAIVELYVAVGMRGQALGAEAIVERELNMPAESESALTRYIDLQRQMADLHSHNDPQEIRQIKLNGDVLTSIAAPSHSDIPAGLLSAGRAAEYAVSDQMMLAVLTLGLMLIAVGIYIPAVWRGKSPALFMGWRRLLLATLVAISPVAVYAAYCFFEPLSGRDYGLHVSPDRLLVEYAAVAVAVRMLISVMARRELRQRAVEVGAEMAVEQRGRWDLALDLAIGIVVIVYLIAWRILADRMGIADIMPTRGGGLILVPVLIIYGLSDRDDRRWYGAALAALLAAGVVIAWVGPSEGTISVYAVVIVSIMGGMAAMAVYHFIRNAGRKAGGSFNFARSEVPLFVTTALAMAIVFGPILSWRESRAVSEMSRANGSYSFHHELDFSPWHDLQQHIAQAD